MLWGIAVAGVGYSGRANPAFWGIAVAGVGYSGRAGWGIAVAVDNSESEVLQGFPINFLSHQSLSINPFFNQRRRARVARAGARR